ncbi:MAG: hypothetical protein EOO76_13100 [Novosphingobium sp.]|nr:MAG: hypothetical protein EOO76_13100 [Novosphingobium sp.]
MALALEAPSKEATHWTVREMTKGVGIAAFLVVNIWHDHGIAHHRWRSLLSNDKAIAEKLHDVVGLTSCRPPMPVALFVDERSEVQTCRLNLMLQWNWRAAKAAIAADPISPRILAYAYSL